MTEPLLNLAGMSKSFDAGGRTIHAVSDVSLDVHRGSTHGLIGESGSGKSTLGRLALGLLEPDSGTVTFDGQEFTGLSHRDRRAMRRHLTVVFQEPFESLNPRMRVGAIVEEPLVVHGHDDSRSARQKIVRDTFELVQLDPALADRYPAELSGGQQQRVGVARAIVTRPKLVVLDEPTSSLDVSVRARIIDLLQGLQRDLDLAYLFISHDINTVRYVSDRISVMLLGRVIESAPTSEIFAAPKHPYTMALMSAALSPRPDVRGVRIRLRGDGGLTRGLNGCALVNRCPFATDVCAAERPPLADVGNGHLAACFHTDRTPSLLHATAEPKGPDCSI